MSEYTQVNLIGLCAAGSAPQGRSQSSFEPCNRALDLRPLAIFQFREPAVHLTTILGFCPTTAASSVQADHRAANAQLIAGISMIGLGIVARVGQQPINVQPSTGATQHRRQQRRILRRTVAHQYVDQQMRGIVTGQGQLRPIAQLVAFLAGAAGVMRRTVSRVQARGVDAGFLFAADQVLVGSVDKDRVEQFVKPTFFNRRCCAL